MGQSAHPCVATRAVPTLSATEYTGTSDTKENVLSGMASRSETAGIPVAVVGRQGPARVYALIAIDG